MKSVAFILLWLLLPVFLYCQTIEFFTADWKKTKNREKASYYRAINYGTNGQPMGVVNDYYISGQRQWCGYIYAIDKNGKETRDGWCTWFYPNGQLQQQSFYFQGKLDSTTYYWNEHGDLTGEEDYRNNVLHGASIRYFPNKKPRLVAVYENGRLKDNVYLEYAEDGTPAAVYPEFFDNTNEWTLFNGKDYSSEIKDSKLWLDTKTGYYRTYGYKYMKLDAGGNFSIEVSITPDKGHNGFKSHGIMWGAKDTHNYDYFMISDQGSFQTGYIQNGIDVKTLPWSNTSAIKPGKSPNILKVVKINDKYIFIINGQAVATAPFQPMMGSYTGVTVASGIERIYIDRFIVRQEAGMGPKPKDAPAGDEVVWNITGSGILIDRNGFIATNAHVIAGAQIIEVEFVKNEIRYLFNAEVIKADTVQDLAILKINDTRYSAFKPSALPYGITTDLLDIGSGVFALGYPEMWMLGKNIKFTDGKISAQTGAEDNPYWYQITVPIQHGNSGGPLFDNDGNLVGLTNAGFVGKLDNVSYAIKSNLLVQMLSNSFPGKYTTPVNTIREKPLTEKIKVLKQYVPLIKVKLKDQAINQ